MDSTIIVAIVAVIAIIQCIDPTGEVNYTYRPLNDIINSYPDVLSKSG